MLRQTEKRWISSPLGSRLLLALLGNENPLTMKYVQIDKALKNKNQLKTKNNTLYSEQYDNNYKKGILKNAIKTDFRDHQKSSKLINELTGKIHSNKSPFKFIKPEMTLLLINKSSYEDRWNSADSCGSIMKVHNTFNYTEDIKYEARLLEFPMEDKDFKLVIIVPNEVDVLNSLLNTLYNDGLTAVIRSIQPLFTSVQKLNAPYIQFDSESGTKNCSGNDLAIAEFGNVKINDTGISIHVVTCIFPSKAQELLNIEYTEDLKATFYLGLIFKDMPIFTGKYVDVLES